MPKGIRIKLVYEDGPRVRVVEGLKPYKNPVTRFEHDRVETRDFGARAYVFCRVTHGGYAFDMIFGWLHASEPEPIRGKDDKVKVVTMTSAERMKLREHLGASRRPDEVRLSFW
ncbi:MAG: hypothetical protein QY323_00185 [Patescibacteria group bacterium]|nr:MAG: hypothetical protein QY323_00185 [Patescibacteria group bacterium]